MVENIPEFNNSINLYDPLPQTHPNSVLQQSQMIRPQQIPILTVLSMLTDYKVQRLQICTTFFQGSVLLCSLTFLVGSRFQNTLYTLKFYVQYRFELPSITIQSEISKFHDTKIVFSSLFFPDSICSQVPLIQSPFGSR